MRRRQFLRTLIASGTLPALSWADAGNPGFVAAAQEADGSYALIGLDRAGQDAFHVPLPVRGHAAAIHPQAPEFVAIARRPGRVGLVIDCLSGRVTGQLDAPEGRHFYGHGCFVEGGAVLVLTENNIASGEGRLSFWDRAAGYVRMFDVPSGGIGPHEVLTLADGSIAVANGGIRTHPDQGRAKLNLETMQPSLAYLTPQGEITEAVALPPRLHLASIRHLASRGDRVAFAMQWQGDLPDPAPLLGLHQRGAAVQLCATRMAEQMAMKGYAGSVALSERHVAITSPRGGRVHLYDHDGTPAGSFQRADICGICAVGAGFVATDGMGGIWQVDEAGLTLLRRTQRRWDNHMMRIGATA